MRRLQPGDTIALVNPSGAVYERAPYDIAIESLQALGFKVREAPNLRARYGQFAGTDAQRASDVNALFADPSVHARTGLVSFHCPVASSEWNAFSIEHWRGAVVEAQAMLLANPQDKDDNVVARTGRISTLRGGKARGPLLGGNLAVLTSMAGSPYWPAFDGAILFLEDINEYIYRVDRMLSTLKLSGVLERLNGVVLGAFTKCEPGDGHYGTLTLDEVFDDYFKPLNVPVYRGAQFGHIKRKLTLPVGLDVEMDADAGTIRYLQPAVL